MLGYSAEMPTKRQFPKSVSTKVFGHPLRVALYARVSTHDQQTLPLQIHTMREYAAKRGWTIAAQNQRSRFRCVATRATRNSDRRRSPP